jgi:hypothetical protein
MHSLPIRLRHDPEVLTHLGNISPVTDAPIGLHFRANRIVKDVYPCVPACRNSRRTKNTAHFCNVSISASSRVGGDSFRRAEGLSEYCRGGSSEAPRDRA